MFTKKFDYKYFLVKYFPIVKHRLIVFRAFKTIFSFLKYLPGSSLKFGPPRGIYVNAELYNSVNKDNPIVEVVLQEEKKFTREIPLTNSELVYNQFKNLLKTKIIERKGFYLTKSRYFISHGGTVVTSDDKIFLPCSPIKNESNPNKHQSLFRLKLPKCHSFKKVVLIDTKGAYDNYGHWLRDHLSRFYWLKEMNVKLSDYTLISTFGNNHYHNYSYEIMKAKGFNFADYISTNRIKHFYSDSLVIPPYVNHAWESDYTTYDSKESVFLQSMFIEGKNISNTYDRIYISRRKSIRTSAQEVELVEKLSHFGIMEIFLEDLNMSQQATIFNNANLIIGFHGSGFANLRFCKPTTSTVVEIFPPDFIRTDFWDAASILNLRYFAYTEDRYKKNISNFRLAGQERTIIDLNNFINFCTKENIF